MNRIAYLMILALAACMRPLPWPALKALAFVLGRAVYHLIPLRKKTVTGNIAKTLNTDKRETARIAKAAYVNTTRVFLETLKFSHALPPIIRKDEENLTNALKKGKGVLIVTAHLGNWELAGSTVSEMTEAYAVGRKIKNPELDAWIRENRRRKGLLPIYKTSTSSANRDIIRALKKNAAVILLIDQYRPGGAKATFMGVSTRVPEGPYRLARLTGAAVMPACMPMMPDGTYRAIFGPEIPFEPDPDRERELSVNTQNYMLAIEEMIRRWPEQWFWFHRRFKGGK